MATITTVASKATVPVHRTAKSTITPAEVTDQRLFTVQFDLEWTPVLSSTSVSHADVSVDANVTVVVSRDYNRDSGTTITMPAVKVIRIMGTSEES